MAVATPVIRRTSSSGVGRGVRTWQEDLTAAVTLSTVLGAGGGGRKYIDDTAVALAEWATEIGR